MPQTLLSCTPSDSPDAAAFSCAFSIYAPAFPPTARSARRVYLALCGAVLHRCCGDQDCHVARLPRYASKRGFPNPTPLLSFA
ncbi:hypothetical protein B0H14DRAFT_3491676 [Mycena olivaceomarginata]|nr:hypothetical protein B0H14DRAFT_3491676 [Mycena olivaceomarginata]